MLHRGADPHTGRMTNDCLLHPFYCSAPRNNHLIIWDVCLIGRVQIPWKSIVVLKQQYSDTTQQ
jgi:hypothetical protein